MPCFYENDLEREISSKTQNHNEKISLFISSMMSLFDRLSVKPSEESIVNRIPWNDLLNPN